MIKDKLKLIFSILLVSALACGFFSCSNGSDSGSNGVVLLPPVTPTEDQTPPNGDNNQPQEDPAAIAAREMQKALLKDMAGTWQLDSEYNAKAEASEWLYKLPKKITVTQSGGVTMEFHDGSTTDFASSTIPDMLKAIPEDVPNSKVGTVKKAVEKWIADAKEKLTFFPNDKDVTVWDKTKSWSSNDRWKDTELPDNLYIMETAGGKLHVIGNNGFWYEDGKVYDTSHVTYSRASSGGGGNFSGSLSGNTYIVGSTSGGNTIKIKFLSNGTMEKYVGAVKASGVDYTYELSGSSLTVTCTSSGITTTHNYTLDGDESSITVSGATNEIFADFGVSADTATLTKE